MEFVTTCDICNSEYDESVVIPKILRCGHTFCLPCLNRLIEFGKSCELCDEIKFYCPTCRKEMEVNEDCPTNYYAFNAINFAKKENGNETASSRIKALKTKLALRKIEISDELKEINDNLTQLEGLTEKKKRKRNRDDNQIVDLDNAINVLDTIENKYIQKMKIAGLSILIDSADIRLSHYENTDEYLLKIYNKLQKNEVIYAVKNIDDVVKYGKVSFQDNLLLFHALTEDEKPDNSSLIWFDDLKECGSEENFFSFLKLNCNENGIVRLVTISMLNNRLATTFITLCTGECGQSYKGSYYKSNPFQDDTLLGLIMHKESNFEMPSKHIDYNTERENNKIFYEGDIIATIKEEGRMFLSKLLDDAVIANAVGTIETPNDLETCLLLNDSSKKLKILDSGICMKL